LQTYRRQPITLVRGEGVRLFDADGREYFDLLSGIGVASLGHANPKLAAALADQAKTLIHTSNLFYHPLQGQLAAKLSELSGLPRAFFCNSGTEAVEACLKFARRYWHTLKETRTEIVAFEESFHGRTMGALSMTSDEHYRAPFEPLFSGVRWIPINDVKAIEEAVTSKTVAVIVEPIQGEGGIRPITAEAAAAINAACARTGALLISDEIQSSLGRTGHIFQSKAIGLAPNLISLGKALGAGMPVGAVLLDEKVASKISYGDHGTTYGGNLLACRAALCFLEELTTGGVLENVLRVGPHFEATLRAIAAKHSIVKELRGAGLMWGLNLNIDAAPVVPAGLARGVIVNRTAEPVVRLLPPLTITEEESDAALARLDAALSDVAAAALGGVAAQKGA
jgi:predicted acetylornithine/succinylornithine family transaminase